ncbi:LuxR C-terminal-related transcriptional regulator [Agromyces sp. NPDC058484]|uniref:LuxR C-terminal-related transcriptional regulator n=1 Tax=Agromyces sp. NPDC058484 TaxID=3346524 RepID=UPI003648B4A6
MASAELHIAARQALVAGRWGEARDRFASVLSTGENADARAGLGAALWWLGDVKESLRERERAYAGYLADGSHAEASVIALAIGTTYLSNLGNDAAAVGWIARADRAAQTSGDRRLAGWVWLMQGYTSTSHEQRLELQSRALDLARETGDADLELTALADLGLSLVGGGESTNGLRLLDEAMAGTLGGECEHLETVVWNSCSMLAACSMLGDLKRAVQWCAAADDFTRQYGCPFLQATCRSHYGRILVSTGDWDRAESELQHALSMAEDCGRGSQLEALAGLAQLRLRQGRLEEAAVLATDLGDGPDNAVVVAEVLCATGHPERAAAVLTAALDQARAREILFPVLAAGLVDAQLACGEPTRAESTARLLEETARGGHEHPQAQALCDRALGLLDAVAGRPEAAARRLRAAIAELDELGLPFESARTRLELAQFVAPPDPPLAIIEADRARNALERLGAARESARAAALLRTLGVATKPGARRLGVLSHREQEVLALVRQGLTNPQIAEDLFISRRTVAHHVSSILAKLNLRTRSEAAAFAAREDARQPTRV